MIRHGTPPYLECSSRGDKRFSAFYACLGAYNGKPIEVIYQAAKVFALPGGGTITGRTWREAKGRRPINTDEVHRLYSHLWDLYMAEHPELIDHLTHASGLSDIFGEEGHCCQATELWRIRARALADAQDT